MIRAARAKKGTLKGFLSKKGYSKNFLRAARAKKGYKSKNFLRAARAKKAQQKAF